MQSHYKFKEYLKVIVEMYKTKVFDINESYISQYCKCCGLKIDRDINGSWNIYLKSICSKPGMKYRLAVKIILNFII